MDARGSPVRAISPIISSRPAMTPRSPTQPVTQRPTHDARSRLSHLSQASRGNGSRSLSRRTDAVAQTGRLAGGQARRGDPARQPRMVSDHTQRSAVPRAGAYGDALSRLSPLYRARIWHAGRLLSKIG